ncbi:MAG TPA: transglutaminase family protein [Acidimicrobiales bacterium]|nr:transglutaminase family protein [Acidimicrobiales bacterium]
MSWKLDICHVTSYHYDRPVVSSYNEARVTPMGTDRQLVGHSEVRVEPQADVFAYYDYWGSLVHTFDIHDPHETLVVTSVATVETSTSGSGGRGGSGGSSGSGGPGGEPGELVRADGRPVVEGVEEFDGADGASWEELATSEIADRYYEFLAPSRLVNTTELSPVARELREASSTPLEAARAGVEWAHGQLEYGGGATDVGTSAIEAWRAGRGVCQDYAHLSLAVLRAMNIPARYVSGYFYPNADGVVDVELLGESHAWVEAWTGEWAPHDPTNGVPVDERHVVVARGRDYYDVAPMRGIYSGPPGSSNEVSVKLTRRA